MNQPFLNDTDFFKSIIIDEHGNLMKARKVPVGTVSKGYKKIAEGKWIPVKKERKKKEYEKFKKKVKKLHEIEHKAHVAYYNATDQEKQMWNPNSRTNNYRYQWDELLEDIEKNYPYEWWKKHTKKEGYASSYNFGDVLA